MHLDQFRVLQARLRSGFHGEPDFDGHLPVIHLPLVDVAARFDHLEPAQVLDGLVRAFNGLINGVLDGSGRGSGEFDEFIDVVFHVRFLGLVHHRLDGSVAAQGFGIGAGFVRFIHDALSLGAIDSRELRMQLHRQAVAAVVILDQAHQRPHRGILDRCAELFGRVAQGAVVTGGIRARE